MDDEIYLGDAVYASFDGWQIWLRTGDGNDQRIALEPGVLSALFNYARTIRAVHSIPEQQSGDEACPRNLRR